jgi:hypothetical protein
MKQSSTYSSTLKMLAVFFSETYGYFLTTQLYNPEDCTLLCRCCENHKSNEIKMDNVNLVPVYQTEFTENQILQVAVFVGSKMDMTNSCNLRF